MILTPKGGAGRSEEAAGGILYNNAIHQRCLLPRKQARFVVRRSSMEQADESFVRSTRVGAVHQANHLYFWRTLRIVGAFAASESSRERHFRVLKAFPEAMASSRGRYLSESWNLKRCDTVTSAEPCQSRFPTPRDLWVARARSLRLIRVRLAFVDPGVSFRIHNDHR